MNCPICTYIRENIIDTQDIIAHYLAQIQYYDTRVSSLIFAGVNHRVISIQQRHLANLHQLYTSHLETLESIYDSHSNNHNL